MVALAAGTVPTGQELLAEFIQYGQQRPFEEIVRRYAGMVFNVCYRITKDKHEAEDATQAVFLTLALQARRGADIKALGPWLQQVAKRLSLDSRRSKKRRKTREERHQVEQTSRMESILGDTLPSADMDELKTILHEELQKLPAKYRLPLILHYFGGLTRDEMAAELNCKPSTLGVRIFRGREMLAGRLSGRGITISAGMLAAGLAYAVKRAISDNLIASTSHAATAIMAGYDGGGYASANVIGLTRRATSALAFGKVRITAITLMMAGTSLGAGAKAMGILPKIDIQQMITNQLNRLIQPLLNPLSHSLRVDAQSLPARPSAASTPVVQSATGDLATSVSLPVSKVATKVNPSVAAATPAAGGNNTLVVDLASSTFPLDSSKRFASVARSQGDSNTTTAVTGGSDKSTGAASAQVADPADAASTTTASDSGSISAVAAAMALHSTDSLPTRATPSAYSGIANVAINSNNLVVGYASFSASNSTARTAGSGLSSGSSTGTTPLAIVQIPAINGTVTETSTGVLSGYGTIDRTGVLYNDGQIIANGNGIDRTLNLKSFTSVQTAGSAAAALAMDEAANVTTPAASSVTMTSNINTMNKLTSGSSASSATGSAATSITPTSSQTVSAAPVPTSSPNADSSTPSSVNTQGWYAINHGRLCMGLQTGADPSLFTWGENPGDGKLALVNSVRLSVSASASNTGSMPTDLSLLATDRSDAPSLAQIDGVPIGLWEVDSPDDAALSAADITVCYDASLADALGASPSSIDLWTWGGPGTAWAQVNSSSLLLDTNDQMVSGYGDDISYFAVTAIPAAGANVRQLLADHLSQVADLPTPLIGGANPTSIVPEPTALLPLLAGAMALLGRRKHGPPGRR